MGILSNLTNELKDAMRAKDKLKLEALRSIKTAVILQQTQADASGELSDEDEIKLVQKLVKQRRDSATIFREQNRPDLAEPEEAQAEVISAFLPQQLTEEEIKNIVTEIVAKTGATGMKDMGKVMGMSSKQMAGKADGKTISTVVKSLLS